MKIEELKIILKDKRTKSVEYKNFLEDDYWYINVYNKEDNIIYQEDSSGYWEKYEYDEHGNETFWVDSTSYNRHI